MEDSMKSGFKIKAITVQNGDFTYRTFRLSGWKADGERVRRQFQSREAAEGEKSRLEVEAANAASGTRTLQQATQAIRVRHHVVLVFWKLSGADEQGSRRPVVRTFPGQRR